MKLSTLKKQAQKSTAFRGHRMRWGQEFVGTNGSKSQIGICKCCGRMVLLLERVLPNQIDIGGSALAENCK